MRPLTPQQIADAAAKRAAAVAQRKATGGLTVRQQRAAAKAAKLGQPAPTVPPPAAPRPAPTAPPFRRRRRRSGFAPTGAGWSNGSAYGQRPGAVVNPAAPLFPPKPEPRALKLAALVAIEDAFKATPVARVTQEMRDAFAKYEKLKTRALAVSARPEDQNEADTALRVAVAALVRLAF